MREPFKLSGERPEGEFVSSLRRLALIAVLVGALGAAGFLLRAGQRTPRLLLTILLLWVLSPFMAVVLADLVSKRWAILTRATLYGMTLVVTLGSLITYVNDALRPRKAQAGFVFVVVPLVSWVLIAVVVPIAALIAGRLSRRSEGA